MASLAWRSWHTAALTTAVRRPPPVMLQQQQQRRSVQAMAKLYKGRKIGVGGYLMLAIPGGGFCLGCWQVQRLRWKAGLVKDLEEKVARPAIPLPSDLSQMQQLEYQRVLLRGTFDHTRELLLGPRPLMRNGAYMENGSMLSSGNSGFLVVTPFTLTDTGDIILVNRGWVHKKKINYNNRAEGRVEGVQELTGVVRLHENRPPFMHKHRNNDRFLHYRDVERMSELTGACPVFVDACDGVAGGPLPGQTNVSIRNEHLSYLTTWYALSFITAFLWYRRFINYTV